MLKPLCIDLYCGLGGWAEGFLAEGWSVIGFDIERRPYPGQLVLQDVTTLHGKQFRDAAVIVASPPCQAYSYRAMPWRRAKSLPPPDNSLFEACFQIQREAIQATSQNCPSCGGKGFVIWCDNDRRQCERCEGQGYVQRYIPLIVENVQGAQKWVGRARWHYGSFYLWGDVPALMPLSRKFKGFGGSWFAENHNTTSGSNGNPVDGTGLKVQAHVEQRDGHSHTRHLTNPAEHGVAAAQRYRSEEGVKQRGSGAEWFDKALDERRRHGSKVGGDWFGSYAEQKAAGTISPGRLHAKNSHARGAASAEIAKIPFPLARWIAQCFREQPEIL